MVTERRRNPRYRVALNVTLHVGGGGRTLLGTSVDVSRSGIFVQTEAPFSVGQRVDVMIESGLGDGLIMVGGLVVHAINGQGVGIRFTVISAKTQERINALIDHIDSSAA